ncbi:MAG: VOC family protein [Rhizobiaceae bacterium]
MKFVPYLNFKGDCREAFEFYAHVLDGKITGIFTFGEAPGGSGVDPAWNDKIMNAHMMFGEQELMGCDAPPHLGDATMNGFTISIQLDDEERANRIFDAFAEGGSIVMPYGPTFWAKQFGMVTDRFGTPWMINCGMIAQEEVAA